MEPYITMYAEGEGVSSNFDEIFFACGVHCLALYGRWAH